jgi:hypothetical protein
MKKKFYLLTGFVVLFLAACKPTPEEGIKYNDEIIAEQVAVMGAVDGLDEAITTYEGPKMDAAYAALNDQLDISIKKVEALKDFDGKHDFKDVTIKYFNAVREGMKVEMQPIIALSKKPIDSFTDEDEAAIDKLFDANIDRVAKVDNEFGAVQEKFAKEYGFKIEDKKIK